MRPEDYLNAEPVVWVIVALCVIGVLVVIFRPELLGLL